MNWWNQVVITVQAEFSDLLDIADVTKVCVRMSMAVLLGGLIGYDREKNDSAAGLRTHMLVALGAALFVLVPMQSGMEVADVGRVLQGIVAGIGFLGAGAIIKMNEREQIKGLTTAASIWATAAVGIATGMGREMTAIVATAFALVILGVLPGIERLVASKRPKSSLVQTRTKNVADVQAPVPCTESPTHFRPGRS
jgi:putative Mg2+ transporter-C (MgtC) family protein